jgi:hypothetical protein
MQQFINIKNYPEIKFSTFIIFIIYWFQLNHLKLNVDTFTETNLDFKKINSLTSKSWILFSYGLQERIHNFVRWCQMLVHNLLKLEQSKQNIKISTSQNLIEHDLINKLLSLATKYTLPTNIYLMKTYYFNRFNPVDILKKGLKITSNNRLFYQYVCIELLLSNENFRNYLEMMNVDSIEHLDDIDVQNLYYFFEIYYKKGKNLQECALIANCHGSHDYGSVNIVPEGRSINFTGISGAVAKTYYGYFSFKSSFGFDNIPVYFSSNRYKNILNSYKLSLRYGRKYGPGNIVPQVMFANSRRYPFVGFLKLTDCWKCAQEQMFLNGLQYENYIDSLFFNRGSQYGFENTSGNLDSFYEKGQDPLDLYFDGCRVDYSKESKSYKLYEQTLELLNSINEKITLQLKESNPQLQQEKSQKQKAAYFKNYNTHKKRYKSFSSNVQSKTKKTFNIFKLAKALKQGFPTNPEISSIIEEIETKSTWKTIDLKNKLETLQKLI